MLKERHDDWHIRPREVHALEEASVRHVVTSRATHAPLAWRRSTDVYAPNGFDDIAKMIVRPNHGPNFSEANYAAKASRWKTL
jgi:hypothetical protein